MNNNAIAKWRQRFKDYHKDESHRNYAATYYWMEQYKTLIRDMLTELETNYAPVPTEDPVCFLCYGTGKCEVPAAVPAGVPLPPAKMMDCPQCKAKFIDRNVAPKEVEIPALSDDQLIGVIHSVGVDTRPSRYGFKTLQVDATSLPTIRSVVAKSIEVLRTNMSEFQQLTPPPYPALPFYTTKHLAERDAHWQQLLFLAMADNRASKKSGGL